MSQPAAHPRQPRGIPVGGQWATRARSEATLALVTDSADPAAAPVDVLAAVLDEHPGVFDEAQIDALWGRACRYVQRRAEVEAERVEAGKEPDDQKADWEAGKAAWLHEGLLVPNPRVLRAPADAVAARAEILTMADKAERALARQVNAVASLHGVETDVVSERVAALRAQYADLARLDEPLTPPLTWVHGFTRNDPAARGVPTDPATMYAFYRAQGDEALFADMADRTGYVSVDIETASPTGKDGFDPANGHIIEFGAITFDHDGTEVARIERLARPNDAFLSAHGTGRSDIHGIAPADLDGQPTWEAIAPECDRFMAGRRLLAQNDSFERSWLGHHFPAAGAIGFDPSGPGSDTLQIARQHLALPKNTLAHICAAVGVPYTNGHRAMHDADVAAQAFFAMRRKVFADYRANEKFARLPLP